MDNLLWKLYIHSIKLLGKHNKYSSKTYKDSNISNYVFLLSPYINILKEYLIKIYKIFFVLQWGFNRLFKKVRFKTANFSLGVLFFIMLLPQLAYTQTEKLDDPGFEKWDGTTLDANASNWKQVGTVSSVDRYTGTVHGGSVSVRLENPTTSYGGRGVESSNMSPINTAYTYDGSVWGYLRYEAGVASDTYIYVSIKWYDSGQSFLSETVIADTSFSAFSNWTKFESTGISPPGSAAYASLYITIKEAGSDDNDVYIDDASLLEYPAVLPHLSITKTADAAYNLHPSDINVPVLSFKVSDTNDSGTHTLAKIEVKNLGTATTSDIQSIKLYYDYKTLGAFDSDSYIANLYWSSAKSAWTNFNLSAQMTNFLITVDISAGATAGNTIKAYIPVGGIECSVGSNNQSAVTNGNIETIYTNIAPGDIVINEIMWMGTAYSNNDADEWIELRNLTGYNVNFFSRPYSIYRGDGTLFVTIDKGILEANGYFLIANKSSSDSDSGLNINPDIIKGSVTSILNTSSCQLILYNTSDNSGTVIDTAGDNSTSWFAGDNTNPPRKSMVRVPVLGDGTLASDWYTATNQMGWKDDDTVDYGTPGLANVPDLTSPAQVTNLVAKTTNTNGGVVLHWTAPGDDNWSGTVSGYIVRYSFFPINTTNDWNNANNYNGAGEWYNFISGGNNEIRIVDYLPANTAYYFSVRAYDEGGNLSPLGNTSLATTFNDYESPATITNLAVISNYGAGQIAITFITPGDDDWRGTANHYIVKWSTNAINNDTDFSNANTYAQTWTPAVGGSPETYILSGLPGNKIIYVAVKAVDEAGNSGGLSNPAFGRAGETDPPIILSAGANDSSGGGIGIQAGDTVTIIFNESIGAPNINSANIDTVLALSSGHTWLDGNSGISNAYWKSTTYTNDTLVIILSTNGGVPTVSAGDTITCDGSTIADLLGNATSDFTNITGTFGADINPPSFVSAIAYDTGGAAGLNAGDTIIIKFSETMDTNTKSTILANINSALRLNAGAHSWGGVASIEWSSSDNSYDTLTITFLDGTGTIVVGDTIDNNLADSIQDDGPSYNDVTGNILLTGTFGGDTTGPSIISAVANDASGGGIGIQAGDRVVITFDEGTTGYNINSANIDTVLALSSGHTWLDGGGGISSAEWSTNIYSNDTITIILSDTSGAPTVAVGDTITIATGTIEDTSGNDASGGTISGSFGSSAPGTCSIQPSGVSAGNTAALLFTLTGESPYIIVSNRIDINTNWTWTGNISDVSNYGPGFNITGCTLSVITNAPGKYSILISGARVTASNIGYIKLLNMQAPSVPQTTIFKVLTASSNKSLQEISSQPYVLVSVADDWWDAYFVLTPYQDDVEQYFINYCNAAKYKIDFAIYNVTQDNIQQALKDAADRGVKIRIITDADNVANFSTLDGYAGNINVIDDTFGNNSGAGIMHNKFAVFDYGYPGSDSTVEDRIWTGSHNFTAYMLNSANNVFTFKNHAIASNYEIEFNEMWGASSFTPDSTKAAFGANKVDNTAHYFSVGTTKTNIELYFSPSDGVNSKIVKALQTADYNIYFCIFTFSDSTIAKTMLDKFNAGVKVAGIFDAQQVGSTWDQYDDNVNLLNSIGPQYIIDAKNGFTGLMHHKYILIDVGHPDSDPIVITGSHNWTAAADSVNDENTLIIHDPNLDQKYYAEFLERFGSNPYPAPANATINTTPGMIVRNSTGNKIDITITHDGSVSDNITEVKVIVPLDWPSLVDSNNTIVLRGDGYDYISNNDVTFNPVSGGTEIDIKNAALTPSGTANHLTVTINNMTAPSSAGPSVFTVKVSTPNIVDGQVAPSPQVMIKKCALLITEVAFQGGGGTAPFNAADWVELYMADDGNNGNGCDLNGFTITSEDGSALKTITSATLHTGNYAVILFNSSTPDETSDNGAVLNLYTTVAGLTGTDEQVDVYDGSGYLLDATCWANQDGTWSLGEDSDVALINSKGEWNLASTSPLESDCVDSSVVNAGTSICRLTGGSLGADGYLDSNDKTDWAIDTSPTPGTINSATGGGGTANPGDVVVNEIMYDPASSDTYCEWIEFYNTRPYDIDLSGWKFIVGGNTNTISSGIIAGNGYFVIVARETNSTGDSFEKDFGNGNNIWGDDTTYEVYTPYQKGTALGLANTGGTIIINDGANNIDSVTYDPAWGGATLSGITNVSLERKDPLGNSNDANNWGSCLSRWTPYQPHQGTPGSQNSLAGGNNKYICINEVYFEDNDYPDRDEWIEIYNRSGSANISLAGWTLSDYDGNIYTFPLDCIIPPQKYLIVHFNNRSVNDLDFTDGKGDVFTGDTTDILDDNDEIGLYSGATRNSTTLVDFVAWSASGVISNTNADNDAVAVSTNKKYAYWQDNQAVPVAATPDLNVGRTIYLKEDGITTNGINDWAFSSSTNARFFYSEGYPNISSDTNSQKNISNLTIYSSQSSTNGDTVRIGEKFYFRITTSSDPSPGEQTVTTVKVTSSSNDKLYGIIVTLRETGTDTGVFEGWAKVDANTSNDPLQWIKAGTLETIRVEWNGNPAYYDTIVVAGSSAEDIVINEFVPNPDGKDNVDATTHLDDEWIEIYNRGIIAHDLSDWTIRLDNGKSYTIPSTVAGNAPVLQPGGFLYVHFEDEYDVNPVYAQRQDINTGTEIHIFEGTLSSTSNFLSQDYGYGGGIALYSSSSNTANYLVDYVRYASVGTGNYTHYLRAVAKGIWSSGGYIDTSGRKNIVGQLTDSSGDSYYPSYGRKTDGANSNNGSDWHWAIKRKFRTDNGGDAARWPLYGGQDTSTNNVDYTSPPDVQILSVADTPNDRGGTITVKWIPVSDDNQGYGNGVWGYAIFYSAGGPFNDCNNAVFYPDSPIKNSTITTCNVQGLKDGQQYWFAVVAIDSNNNFDLLTQSSLSGVTPINNLGVADIVFNEVQYKPKSGTSYYQREFFEIVNRGTNTVNLSGWYMDDPSYGYKYYLCPAGPKGETGMTLTPGGYAVILGKTTEVDTQSEMSPLGPNQTNARWFYLRYINSQGKWATNSYAGPGDPASAATGTLNNDYETAEIYNAAGLLQDVVTYGQNWLSVGYVQSGGSMSKLDVDLSSTDPNSWGESFHTTQSNGTPCRPNAPNSPPMCKIISPNAYVWVGSNVSITVQAEETNTADKINYSDKVDIIELQYSLNSTTGLDGDWFNIGDGLYDITNQTNVIFTTNWNPTAPLNDTDDLVWIRARARDTRYRYSDWTTKKFEQKIKIDNQAPTYTNWIIDNITGDTPPTDDCRIQVYIDDNNGTGLSGTPQIKYFYVNRNGVTNGASTAWQNMSLYNGQWYYNIPSPGNWVSYAGGYVYFKVTSQDVIGNKSVSELKSEYIDFAADHIELTYTDGIAPVSGTELIHIQVKDIYGTNSSKVVLVTNRVSGNGIIQSTTLSNAVGVGTSVVYGYTSPTGYATITVYDSLSETVIVTPNSDLVGSTTTPDRDIGSQVVFKCGPLDHFVIIHDGVAWVNQNEQVIVRAIDIYGNLKTDFTGVVTLSCNGTANGEIDWNTNSSVSGSFTNLGSGSEIAYYTFNSNGYDSGVVTLFIKSDTVDTVDVTAQSEGKEDNDSEGLLYFEGYYPPLYVTSIRLFDSQTYVNDITNARGGTVVFIRAIGYDASPTTQDKMFVTVTSSTSDTTGIKVQLDETGVHTSEFRGYITLRDTSDVVNKYIAAKYPGEKVIVTSDITNKTGGYENDYVNVINSEPSIIDSIRFVANDYAADLSDIDLFDTAYIRLDSPLSAANQYTVDYTFGKIVTADNPTGFNIKFVETGVNTGEYHAEIISATNNNSSIIPPEISCQITGDVLHINSTVDTSKTDTCNVINNPVEPNSITNVSFMEDKYYINKINRRSIEGGKRVYIKATTELSNDGNPLYKDYTYVTLKSSITDPVGITVQLWETGLHTAVYTNSILIGGTTVGNKRQIGAQNIGESVKVVTTVSSQTDSFKVANTPLGLIDDFDDVVNPYNFNRENYANGKLYSILNGSGVYTNIEDYSSIVTNGYACKIFIPSMEDGAGLYISGFAADTYSQLKFGAKKLEGVGSLSIVLKDRNTNASSYSVTLTTNWQLFTINLSSFSGINLTNLYSVAFIGGVTAVNDLILIDDVKFDTPNPISSVTIYSSDYTVSKTNAEIGEQIYIELIGDTKNTNTIDNERVVLKSDTDSTNGIRVILTETGRSTGIYRGSATIDVSTSDAADHIGAHAGDYVYIVSADNPAVNDKIYIKSAGLDHFEIVHDGNGTVGVDEQIVVYAYDINNDVAVNYTGVISLYTIGEAGEIIWKTNSSAHGSFIEGGVGVDWAKYTFISLDKGVVTLYIQDDTVESIDPECMSLVENKTDNDVLPQWLQFNGGITVDGDPSDWPGTWAGTNNAVVDANEWIWKDKENDERTDLGNSQNQDIEEFRITADNTFLYFLIRFRDIDDESSIHFSIGLDTDMNSSDTGYNWIADDAGILLGTNRQYSEKNIDFHYVAGATSAEIELWDGGNWYAPPSGDSQIVISTQSNCIEAKINLTDLGVSLPGTIRLSSASFKNSDGGGDGWNNNVDSTADDGSYDALDVITPSFANSWFGDVKDGDIDFWADIHFTNIGVERVVDNQNAPDRVSLVYPESNGSIFTTLPTFIWNKTTDTDNDTISFYQIQVSASNDNNFLGGILNSASDVADGILRNLDDSNPTNYTLPSSLVLDAGKEYYFRVRAYDRYGRASGWSSIYPFTVVNFRRTVDGDTSDWKGISNGRTNSSVVSSNEWIWTDKIGDSRYGTAGTDLKEIRMIADKNYLYFLLKYNNILNVKKPMFDIAIDTDHQGAGMNWIGDDSGLTFATNTQNAESIVEFFNKYTYFFNDGDTNWSLSSGPINYRCEVSTISNCLEGMIPLSDINLSLNTVKTLFTTFAFFEHNTNVNNPAAGDTTIFHTDNDGDDILTPEYKTSWVGDLNDSKLKYYFRIRIATNGNILNNNSEALPSSVSPANGTTTVNDPILIWDKVTPEAGDFIPYYHVQVSTNSNFTRLISSYDMTTSKTQVHLDSNYFDEGFKYFWRIRSYDQHGAASDWLKRNFIISAFKIIVDGNPSDWKGKLPADVDSWTILSNEWIWRDDVGDERTDGSDPDSDFDITEVRIVADTNVYSQTKGNLFFLVKFNSMLNGTRENINIAICTNINGGTENWLGDDADTLIEDTRGYADFNLNWCFDGTNDMWIWDGTAWSRPISYKSYIGVSSNVFEGRVSLNSFGLDIKKEPRIRFIIGVGEFNNSGKPSLVDKNKDIVGTSDLLDTINPGTGSAWNDELSDSKMDYWFELQFNNNGNVIGGTAKGMNDENTIKSNYPQINIIEVSPNNVSKTDYIKLYCVNDGNNGGGMTLTNYRIVDYDTGMIKRINGGLIYTGDEMLLKFNSGSADEITPTAGVLHLYTTASNNRLENADEVTLIIPYTNDGVMSIMDAVAWGSNNTLPTDMPIITNAGEWINGTVLNWTNLEQYDYSSFIRKDINGVYVDTNRQSDWTTIHYVTVLNVVKSISNVTLGGAAESTIPGATITYKISYSNAGNYAAENALLYDTLSPYTVYVTNSVAGTASGWIVEWSTNKSPNQEWVSSDYTNICPAVSRIKWIRWKKMLLLSGEGGKNTYLRYKVIIK